MNYSETRNDKGDTIFGGQNLPNNGVLYVHKDTTVKKFTDINGSGQVYQYEVGLLKDELEGFNAYFLTDTPELNSETKHAYISVKGSDGPGLHSLNDWLINNVSFTLNDAYTNQGKLTHEALTVKLSNIREKALNAKLNGTGHSLGSIALVQGLANLSVEELKQVGEIVVFNGPDTMKSLKKMRVPDEKIAILKEKVTYYLNPFDMVAMLNREVPESEQVGKVKIIVPLNFKSTLDNGVAHDFGEYQIDSNGMILEATEDFHPEFLRAGEKMSVVLRKYVSKIKEKGLVFTGIQEFSKWLVDITGEDEEFGIEIKYLYNEFKKEYDQIIEETRLETIKWSKANIPKMQEQLAHATGAEKIKLRSYLLLSAGQLAMLETEDRIRVTKQKITAYKNHVHGLIVQAHQQAHRMAYYLNSHEVQSLLVDFQLPNFWDDSLENMSMKQLDEYKVKIDQFSMTLFKAVEQLEELDTNQGQAFESVLGGVQERWGK